MEIYACPKCGSRRIFQGNLGDGVLTGYTSKNVCKNCGFQGMPIIFNTEKDYKNFLQELGVKNIQTKKTPVEKTKEKPKTQNKKIPKEVTILTVIMILNAVLNLIFYYYTIGFQTINPLWIYYIIIFIISAVLLPMGLLTQKKWAWTAAGVLFALSIPIGLIFLYILTRDPVKNYFGI